MENLNNLPFERPNPLQDFFFKKVLGEKGDEKQLLGFLNAVFGHSGKKQIARLEILENRTFSPENYGNKTCIFDVRAVLDNGTRVNIEVQLSNRGNMEKRSLFYWSREYGISIKAGQQYHELPMVIAINIVDFEFFPDEGFHTCFHLREDTNRDLILTDALEIHFIDMVKWKRERRNVEPGGALDQWLAWLNPGSTAEKIEEVKRMNSAIQAADDRLVYLSGDEEAIRAYDRWMMAQCDYASGLGYAKREGIAQGVAQGLTQGHAEGKSEEKLEIARKMKAAGRPMTEIEQFTGLTPEAIAP